MADLSYDVVMATRNRPEAVALSLPLLLAQSRPPTRIVVVDSSDDAGVIPAVVDPLTQGSAIPIEIIRSEMGLTRQRNLGLTYCTADVVIFPDDDSLFFADTAEKIMTVYEADTDACIAGVSGTEVNAPPAEVADQLGRFEAETVSGLRLMVRRLRQRVKEELVFTNPFLAIGNRLNAQHPLPGWLATLDVVPVAYMTGFRMSFRREIIAATGFDETLQRYGWFEDIDASWQAMRRGLVVSCRTAPVYHHRAAAARDGGFSMGQWAILNRAYVVMKHVDLNPDVFPRRNRERARLQIYCQARVIAYRLLARTLWARDRADGARYGLARLKALTKAQGSALAERYSALTAK